MRHVPGQRKRTATRVQREDAGGRARLAVLLDPREEAAAARRGDVQARARLARAAAIGEPLRTPAGRPRSPVTLPEYRRGRAPANKGKRYPAEILTPAEIRALLEACPGGAAGARSRALVVLLWRSGLRISEALALRPYDLDLELGELGAVTVLSGKGAKRRVIGVDAEAVEYLRTWLCARAALGVPAGARLFCTVSNDRGAPGRPLRASAFREQLKRAARNAGIEKRVHPHGLRHTHAFELANESVPVHVIQAQLGHNKLSITAKYIDHLAPQQVFRAIADRRWPGSGPSSPAPVTRATASQGLPAPLQTPGLIPAYTPVPREPQCTQLERATGKPTPRGTAKAKLLEVLRANGGRATQAQLARALRCKDATVRKHCEQLAVAGEIMRGGSLARPEGGRPYAIWALPALRAIYEVDPSVEVAAHARRGQGALRVLRKIEHLGGRASQAQLAGEIGIASETVGVHCRALERDGKLERGGLDKATSNRGSQVWRLPERARFGMPTMMRLSITGHSSSTPTRRSSSRRAPLTGVRQPRV